MKQIQKISRPTMLNLTLTLFLTFTAISSLAAETCPNFSGKYTHYTCAKMSAVDDGSNLFYWMIHNEAEAAEASHLNPTYIITQKSCDLINVDGQEAVFSTDTNIYLTGAHFKSGDAEYRSIGLSITPDSIDATFQIKDSSSILPSKNRFHFTLTKQSDGSVHIVESTQSKALWTLGLFKKGSQVDCVFSP